MKRHRVSVWARIVTALVLPLIVLSTTAFAAPLQRDDDPPWPTIPLPPGAEILPIRPAESARDADPRRAKLDSSIYRLVTALHDAREQADDVVTQEGLQQADQRVQVQLRIVAGDLPAALAAIQAAGGSVTGTSDAGALLQAWLPLDAIEALAALPIIRQIHRPTTFHALEGTQLTEGFAAMSTAAWQTAGLRGAGVKIGVIDGGFTGWEALQGTDLPNGVVVRNFVDGQPTTDVSGSPHGTACAEIIFDIAPGATLYLAKIATDVDMDEAAAWLAAQGVDIISTSLGFYAGPGDGTSVPAQIVARARTAGILWITAAGNERETHWGGAWADSNANAFHNWNGAQEINYFGPGDGRPYEIPPGTWLFGFLRWDDWTAVNQDYDLRLYRWNGTSWSPVFASLNPQSGEPGQRPVEYINYRTPTTLPAAPYGFVITRFSATRAVHFDFFADPARLDDIVPAGSLSTPADSPDALTVAAIDVTAPYPQEPYSSEGPTNGPGGSPTGGLPKPDLAAYANVSTVSYGPRTFNGTSAATPHVAGAAALLLGAFPTADVHQLRALVEQRTLDLGVAGRDPQYGLGRLFLGDPPPVAQPGMLQFTTATGTTAEGAGMVDLQITRTGGSAGSVSVTCVTTTGGTATAGADYTAVSRSITFAAGDTTPKSCSIPILEDALVEVEETILVGLSAPTGGALLGTPAIATVRISDNDVPGLTIADVTVSEGNAGTTPVGFVVRLSEPSSQPVTVQYQTVGGSAQAPGDYTAQSGTLTFAPGQIEQTILVAIQGETLYELDETFSVQLSNPNGATISRAQATGTIRNDDAPPSLTIDDATRFEGASGSASMPFAVRLSAPSSVPVTVQYQTVDGSAVAPGDYTAQSGTLTFMPGQTLQTISVPIIGDTLAEPDETFTVQLSNPSGASISRAQATGRILNDDAALPLLLIADTQVLEGNAGTTPMTFTVRLSGPSNQPVTVQYQTFDGSAQAPGDYTAQSGMLTFAPGQTVQTITVLIIGDLLTEPDETVDVQLSAPSGATISRPQATGTIQDDDDPVLPTLSIDDTQTAEGTPLAFTVRLSAVSDQPVTVQYQTVNGSAQAPGDYTAQSGTLTFAPGEIALTLSVPTVDDTLDEQNETVTVQLSNPSSATLDRAQATGVILDNDLPIVPELTIADVSLIEGHSGTRNAVFTVRLSAARSQPVTVAYETLNGSAMAPGDYASRDGTLTFAPGQTAQTIAVQVVGDTLPESDEIFMVQLHTPSGATISRAQAFGTIINDDESMPSLTIHDARVVEGHSGSTTVQVRVSLSAPINRPVTVVYQTRDGTAQAGSDYVPLNATLQFAPGTTDQTIWVTITGDRAFELNEFFVIELSNPVNTTLARKTGTITIVSDDVRLYLPLVVRPDNWVTLVNDDFEGAFPGAWQLSDRYPGTGQYTWNKRTCQVAGGTASGWAVGGGANGAGLPCGSTYPNDAESWMVFGPFSLADATAADLRLKLWLNSELNYDGFCMMASLDNRDYYGDCITGMTGGWVTEGLDLRQVYGIGNLAGKAQVWIALVFSSDGDTTRVGGAYIDNIHLRKWVGPGGPTTVAAPAYTTSPTLTEQPVHRIRVR